MFAFRQVQIVNLDLPPKVIMMLFEPIYLEGHGNP